MKPKRVILCPNPYRDSELKVCRQSRDMLESLGMQTSVCLPFQREGYGEELGLSMRPLQQEIRQADLLIAFGGDGIIVSTPTGSTGYSMAAGGPIVEPTARNLLLTPICPHSTRSSSYVLSPEHIITVEAADANRKFVYLSVDGGKAFSLKNGDQVRVSTSKYTTRLVRLSKKSFCEILDKKMGTEASKK